MSLRDELIEAGANAVANDRAEEIEVWHFADAEVALDAFLDCLAENASEWDLMTAQRRWKRSDEAGPGIVPHHPLYQVDALAVLRESVDAVLGRGDTREDNE